MADHVTPRFRKGDVVHVEAIVQYYNPKLDTVEFRVGDMSPSIYVKIDGLPKEPARSVFEVGDEVYRGSSSGKVLAVVDDWLVVNEWTGMAPGVWRQDSCRRLPNDEVEARPEAVADERPSPPPEPPPFAASIAAVEAYHAAEPPEDAMPDALDEAGI